MNALQEYINSIPGLQLWLDATRFNGDGNANPANNATVSEWKDVSGNNRHANQALIQSPTPLTYTIDAPTGQPLLYSGGESGKALFVDGRTAIGADYIQKFL